MARLVGFTLAQDRKLLQATPKERAELAEEWGMTAKQVNGRHAYLRNRGAGGLDGRKSPFVYHITTQPAHANLARPSFFEEDVSLMIQARR